jgi:ligand-binding sensor domain-containing protein
LDCGSPKASFDYRSLDKHLNTLELPFGSERIVGQVMFQVLVDSSGSACVLSHNDARSQSISLAIIQKINTFNGFSPAMKEEKKEPKTSINILVEIKDGRFYSQIKRVNQEAFRASFDRAIDPKIFNTDYNYSKTYLKEYKIKVWNTKNSNVQDNSTDYIAIDKNNEIWYNADEYLAKYNGRGVTPMELPKPTSKVKHHFWHGIVIDNEDSKWLFYDGILYSYGNRRWTAHDSTETGASWAKPISNNAETGEVFFASSNKVLIYKDKKWLVKQVFEDTGRQKNVVMFVQRDDKGQLWIGTSKGTIRIDKNDKITDFNAVECPLNQRCITSFTTDKEGNMYFTLYDFSKTRIENKEEGLAILYKNETWKQLLTSNSGLPLNHLSEVLYDKNEDILWIVSEQAGLIRYDLKDGWEHYHNQNSDIPTSFITSILQDKNGVLYLATRQGLTTVTRKKKK